MSEKVQIIVRFAITHSVSTASLFDGPVDELHCIFNRPVSGGRVTTLRTIPLGVFASVVVSRGLLGSRMSHLLSPCIPFGSEVSPRVRDAPDPSLLQAPVPASDAIQNSRVTTSSVRPPISIVPPSCGRTMISDPTPLGSSAVARADRP